MQWEAGILGESFPEDSEMTEFEERYSLCPPVHDGIQFWQINDQKLQFAIVSISVQFPEAEKLARQAYAELREYVRRHP